MKTNKITLIITAITLIILSGCKTRQITQRPTQEQQQINICELTQKAYNAQPQFATMNISKLNISIDYNNTNLTFKSSIRIATDSIISISIQPALGIEMFRAEFTPQHFTIYDKLNRRYSQNSYEYIKLSWGIDINYKAIEALFSHQIFTPQSTNPQEICKDFKIHNIADTTSIVSTTPIGKFTQQFDIDTNNNRLTMSGIRHENDLVIAIIYSTLKTFDKIQFPQDIYLQTTMTQENIAASLNIEKIKFNEPLTQSNINTSRYKKVGLMELLKK